MREQGNRRRGGVRLRLDRRVPETRSLLRPHHVQTVQRGAVRDGAMLQQLQGEVSLDNAGDH